MHPTIRESSFYRLNQMETVLKPMLPQAATVASQIALEGTLRTQFARSPEIGSATRLLINYVNAMQRSIILEFQINETLDSHFPIDDLLSKYAHENMDTIGSEDATHLIFTSVMSTLSVAVATLIDKRDPMPAPTKKMMAQALGCILVGALDDPLDIFMNVHANPDKTSPNKYIIDTIWPYTKRDSGVLAELTTDDVAAAENT